MAKRTGIKNWMRDAYRAGEMDRLVKQPSKVMAELERTCGGAVKKAKAKEVKKDA